MKPKIFQRAKKLPSDTKLFLFTEEDEARMIVAIERSKKYMRSYGKGRRPFSLVTDHTKYE